ncbi:MAG: DUF1656 domain-containing protein [Rhodopseudomonas sp.]|uniref:DUF1656 domain-containing protein n=1 Tax=Rhodopseudomonas sp. TaxID=1078 RepID=UPI0039E2FC93
MTAELNILGVYVPTILICAAASFILTSLVSRLLVWLNFYHLVWHHTLFNLTIFVVIVFVALGLVSGWPQ